MSRTNTKTREALSNPVVLEKLDHLKAHWDCLPNPERRKNIKELNDLGCPNTEIAKALGLKESAIRHYKVEATPKKASVIEEPYYGNPVQEAMDLDFMPMPMQKMPVPQVPSRRDQVMQAARDFLETEAGSGRFALQTLELATQRCDQWQYCGGLPSPAPVEVTPKAIFAEYNRKVLATNPTAPVEFLARSLLRLMPQECERDEVLRELEAEYRCASRRN